MQLKNFLVKYSKANIFLIQLFFIIAHLERNNIGKEHFCHSKLVEETTLSSFGTIANPIKEITFQ